MLAEKGTLFTAFNSTYAVDDNSRSRKFDRIKGIHYEGRLDYLNSMYSLTAVAQSFARNFPGTLRRSEIAIIISLAVNALLNFRQYVSSMEKFCNLNYIFVTASNFETLI